MASVKSDFNFNTFETQWENLSEGDKALVVKNAAKLDPEIAIFPVLAGIISYHFTVRNNARKGLGVIHDKINKLLSDPDDVKLYLKGQKASASICSRIYSQIDSGMSFNELGFFFKTLLEFKEKGAYFAFQAIYNKQISVEAMQKIIYMVPETSRLAFVDQYIKISPDIRLRFGFAFKKILKSIKNREIVINFYAGLFDAKRNADPFLNNISPDLRDPDQIISNEIKSQYPENIVMGLKALSMIVTRISSALLLDIMLNQEIKKVRIVIYNIIENSSIGVYEDLFEPILQVFHKCDIHEAFHVFKALIVMGRQPPYKLLDMVRDNYPDLMPVINNEISSFSKISFFLIQDIALNKNEYSGSHFKLHLACVLGMIKKRPERVVRILKQYDNDSNDVLRMDVTRFIEKTKQLLVKEKQDIETQFDLVIQRVKKESKKSKGLIKTLFVNSSAKKIENLKKNNNLESLDLQNEIIKDVDLSSSEFMESSLLFNQCIFNNCDFSKSFFSNTYFKAAVFYNIDMSKTKFDMANFDNAFFINVNAKGSVFNKCSFQNVSIYNCDFAKAKMIDASFINSTIAKTSFTQTNFFCSCFAYSNLSAISFVTSNVDKTDFEGAKARFCRFPSHTKFDMQTSDIDYNARKFQLEFEDLPKIDETIVSKINMLIFSEFIHYGELKFLNQNQLSLLTAFDIFKHGQADLFQIIPLLIHENMDFPGLEAIADQTPYGICDYIPGLQVQEVLKKYVNKEKIIARCCQDHAVEGLFTIGSTGSLAQTADSDIDWWVCINEDHFTSKEIELLRTKLEMLEKMAHAQFSTKVTFFLVDILKTRNNDFGDSTIESSGSAQTRLLKEEFYRTMIYIAGRIPLWSVLPTSISINYYNSILKTVSNFPGLTRYIDLGDIHAISTNEYVGASIWQMFKWLKSPFKSVIKMALLEKFIYEYGKESLLCNKYKNEWMNAGAHLKLAQNDSYYILLKNLIDYYENHHDKHSVKLLLTCFFLKLGISKDSQIDNTVFGLKKILLEKCMNEWGWSKAKVFEIGNFKTWGYSDIVKLSNFIEIYMVKKYKIINKAFESILHGKSGISPEDRTMLGRKVLVEFSKQSGKIGKVLLVSRSDRHFQSLQLKYIKKDNQAFAWTLLHKNAKSIQNREEELISADTIEEIGAWLINNSLYNENTIINLVPNPVYVTFDDIRKLYKNMYDFFHPLLRQNINFDQLLMKNRMVCLFVSINFYAPKQDHKVSGYCAVYLNSWGEMFCKSCFSSIGFASMDEVKKDIMDRIGIKRLPLNTAFYFSKGAAR
ncbi:MAG: adenylate cyclase [Desulfobacula sp.]|nr:adenylate cyclase [Desulfobacula sp.]